MPWYGARHAEEQAQRHLRTARFDLSRARRLAAEGDMLGVLDCALHAEGERIAARGWRCRRANPSPLDPIRLVRTVWPRRPRYLALEDEP